MAEIIRPITDDELAEHVPMPELHKYQQDEVYEAVGNALHAVVEETGYLPFGGNFLVQTNEGIMVGFGFAVATEVEN